MKKPLLAILILLTVIGISSNSNATDLTLQNTPAHIYFSPRGGCTEAIINQINNAKLEILIQAYSFTSKDIASAIVKAYNRGVHVAIILDKSNLSDKYSAMDFTAHMRIPTYIDLIHAIAHNKIMIIDKEMVITGSFNFTKAAEEKNAENLLILKNRELAKVYIDNWIEHRDHSERYEGR